MSATGAKQTLDYLVARVSEWARQTSTAVARRTGRGEQCALLIALLLRSKAREAIDAATKAVEASAPYKMPESRYRAWPNLTLVFDPR